MHEQHFKVLSSRHWTKSVERVESEDSCLQRFIVGCEASLGHISNQTSEDEGLLK